MARTAETEVTIRPAVLADVPGMLALINASAEYGLMLPRSLAQLYEAVREFVVAADAAGRVRGCCALTVLGAGAAEVTALTVDGGLRGGGVGRRLVAACLDEARRLGVRRALALTYEQAFFERLGFAVMHSHAVPEKLWAQSVRCAKTGAAHGRQEVAMAIDLAPGDGDGDGGQASAAMAAALEYRVPFVMKRLGRRKDDGNA
jgi:amino-acid N-acetyltransferase